jgi:hypothetical protein
MSPMVWHTSGIFFYIGVFISCYGTDTLHMVYSTLGYLLALSPFTSVRRYK